MANDLHFSCAFVSPVVKDMLQLGALWVLEVLAMALLKTLQVLTEAGWLISPERG